MADKKGGMLDKNLTIAIVSVIGAVLFFISSMIPFVNYCCMIWGGVIGFLMMLLYSLIRSNEKEIETKTTIIICIASSSMSAIIYIALMLVGSLVIGFGFGGLFDSLGFGAVSGVMLFVLYLVIGILSWGIWLVTSIIGGLVAVALLGRNG
jgi:hypothetical protein